MRRIHNNNDNPISRILAGLDDEMRRDWKAHELDWAHRMITIAENARGNAIGDAWDRATRACRSARGDEPDSPYPLPRWFGPRVHRVIGYDPGTINRFKWADHLGIVKIDGVRCLISEPYPWWAKSPQPLAYRDSAFARWEHVYGDFAMSVPADEITASAAYLAAATGCQLVLERVAWHYARCFRMTFLPLNPHLRIKAATELYNP